MESFCFYDCDLCDAEYVGYKSRHLHQRIDEHHHSAIMRHLKNVHGLNTIGDLGSNFSVLKRCNGKLDCLIAKMLFIKEKKPRVNTQSDSTRGKTFIFIFFYLHVQTCYFSSLFCHFKRCVLSQFLVLSFSLDNDVIATSKSCVKLFWPIFVLK